MQFELHCFIPFRSFPLLMLINSWCKNVSISSHMDINYSLVHVYDDLQCLIFFLILWNWSDVSEFKIWSLRWCLQKVSWGDISLADAEKRLLANALLDFSNERFVLISESCIPVYNFQTVYKYITESVHSFVESYDDPSRYGRGRYSRRMGPDIKLRQWRKGSQWFEITRSLAIEIISDYKYYDLFRKYCHPSCYPDEHYIPTYLQIFHPLLNSNRTVTWVDWSLGGPHPASFGRENITEGFIQNIRNNGTECWYNFQRTPICYLFARKFDPSALEPLLNISSKVMGFWQILT